MINSAIRSQLQCSYGRANIIQPFAYNDYENNNNVRPTDVLSVKHIHNPSFIIWHSTDWIVNHIYAMRCVFLEHSEQTGVFVLCEIVHTLHMARILRCTLHAARHLNSAFSNYLKSFVCVCVCVGIQTMHTLTHWCKIRIHSIQLVQCAKSACTTAHECRATDALH